VQIFEYPENIIEHIVHRKNRKKHRIVCQTIHEIIALWAAPAASDTALTVAYLTGHPTHTLTQPQPHPYSLKFWCCGSWSFIVV